jgi:hypothetical protein
MCPVVQKEIAKISAVPMSRHVTAFAIVLRIGMLTGPSPVDPCGSCAALNFGEVRGATPSWLDLHQAGPHTRSTVLIILIDKILSTIESNC